MDNVKIRAYQDGNDFVVYFENVNPDMKAFLQNMFNPIICGDALLEQPQKEAEDPIIPANCGSYSGKHVSDVLSSDGNRGYANIVYLRDTAKVFSDKDSLYVKDLLDQYLFDTFSGIDPQEYAGNLSEEQADEWIKCFNSLIDQNLRQKVKNITGFLTYEDFISKGSLEQKVSLIYNVIMNMGFHQ